MSPGELGEFPTFTDAVIGSLGLALFLALYRLLRGPSLPDRVVALDLIALLAAAMVAAYSVATQQDNLLDAAIVITLIAFLGTVAFATYVARQRSQ